MRIFGLLCYASPVNRNPLRILFVTPECKPWVKTGGLGDVSADLPAALRAAGLDARVLLPAYPQVLAAVPGAPEIASFAAIAQLPAARLLEARLPSGVPALLVDCPVLYGRAGGPYQDASGRDWEDNWRRFGLLSRVAAQLALHSSAVGWRPDVLHCNDWQTALAPAYLRFADEPRAATLAVIHNLAFQGLYPPETVAALGLPPSCYAVEGLEFHGRMSFLKAGLYYADAIATVSPTYAREIQREPLGFGMQALLAARGASLRGILNGIDTAEWDPAADARIAGRYDARRIEGKAVNKAALQQRLGLAVEPGTMLFGVVSRLTEQKGIDLIAEVAAELAALPAQLAVLGAGERGLEQALASLAGAHPGRIAAAIGFDEALAHLIEAGADAFLMPSRFEPCGLNQMYSQRYGTPPVVRATGGLADSVVDLSDATLENGTATGFVFREPAAWALLEAARRAHAAYRDGPTWRRLQRHGMAKDFGWDASAREYAALYARLARRRS